MASFARTSDDETPSIIIHPSHKIAKINDNIYGGFTEYVDTIPRCCVRPRKLTTYQAHGALHLRRHLRPRQCAIRFEWLPDGRHRGHERSQRSRSQVSWWQLRRYVSLARWRWAKGRQAKEVRLTYASLHVRSMRELKRALTTPSRIQSPCVQDRE